jgi:alkylation response protein AidB-like acyl-CoA dehydrogenase
MDLELSDEQTWLYEAVETLLERDPEHRRVWASLVEFGALAIGGDDGLGAIEMCLIARALGAHLAPTPFVGSAAVRFAGWPGEDTAAVALLEPGSGWSAPPACIAEGGVVNGRKLAVEHADAVRRLAVVAASADGPVLAIVERDAPGVTLSAQPTFDPSVPMFAVDLVDAPFAGEPLGAAAIERLTTVGALLAAAEAVGAAGRLFEDACRYSRERRQFGRPISSFQALRHLLADLYVRQASAWSSVLYAAAALDEDAVDARRTAAIAKAYVSRAAREVAHGAIQVFGGIAVTAEHPAHRFLRRVIVREQQFGDAAHHERALGRALAAEAIPEPVS